jgi:hypothetical protein
MLPQRSTINLVPGLSSPTVYRGRPVSFGLDDGPERYANTTAGQWHISQLHPMNEPIDLHARSPGRPKSYLWHIAIVD